MSNDPLINELKTQNIELIQIFLYLFSRYSSKEDINIYNIDDFELLANKLKNCFRKEK